MIRGKIEEGGVKGEKGTRKGGRLKCVACRERREEERIGMRENRIGKRGHGIDQRAGGGASRDKRRGSQEAGRGAAKKKKKGAQGTADGK